VEVAAPIARVVAAQAGFTGSLGRMGHGMQRSFLLAILQVLVSGGDGRGPTLLLACEEPELYQHPPQIRHLASVLRDLAKGNAQVVVTTHSPLLVTGREFECVRLARREPTGPTGIRHTTFTGVSDAVAAATGKQPIGDPGRLAKLHESLNPGLSEMFFAERLVLVEGPEDRAYVLCALELLGRWQDARRLGIHIVPTEGKSAMIQPRAVAAAMRIPTFTMFDGDGHRFRPENPDLERMHRRDNLALLALSGHKTELPNPLVTVWQPNCLMWRTEIGKEVQSSIDGAAYETVKQAALAEFGHDVADLGKDTLFIARLLQGLADKRTFPPVLERLCTAILDYLK
jgi:predicted ATP-dependent endonuclease of OLD family